MNPNESRPPIKIGSRDFARIEQLIESPAWRDQPAARALLDELQRAEVLAPEQMPADVVTMNSTVACVDENTGAELQLTLSYPHEASANEGRVSVLAPAGSALIGLSVGQHIDWPRPDGRPLRLRVTELRYQPEATGDYLR
jgi:regulator of nucleoside diphosphate kinase